MRFRGVGMFLRRAGIFSCSTRARPQSCIQVSRMKLPQKASSSELWLKRRMPSCSSSPGLLRCFSSSLSADINVLSTPNPNAMKFLPPCDVTGSVDTYTVRKSNGAKSDHALCKTLLNIPGVEGVLKDEGSDWDKLEPQIHAAITPYAVQAMKEERALLPPETAPSSPALDRQDPVVQEIMALIDDKVRPNVQADGGDVQVRFMIRNLLCHYIKEVKEVRAVDEDEEVLCVGYDKGVKIG